MTKTTTTTITGTNVVPVVPVQIIPTSVQVGVEGVKIDVPIEASTEDGITTFKVDIPRLFTITGTFSQVVKFGI